MGITKWNACLPPTWKQFIPIWLSEDQPSFDYAANAVGDHRVMANIRLKMSNVVIAGQPFVNGVLEYLDCSIEWKVSEGTFIESPTVVAQIKGYAYQVLQAERLSLNILARASGIATQAFNALSIVQACSDGKTILTGTRKTTPGFRIVEKYSLAVGGLDTHRWDLSQCVMLKDNHVDICGSINSSIRSLKKSIYVKLEVECQDQDEAIEALVAGADIVMLDNMKPSEAQSAINYIRTKYPDAVIECSGDINMHNLDQYASIKGVNIISMGCLTAGYPIADYSLCIASLIHDDC